MFTGIVETTGAVLQTRPDGMTVERPAMFDDITLGSSIAVAGVCLTVVAFDDASMRFDIVPETFAKTTLGSKKPGDRVNLERAMLATSRFEGHIVQGHVDGVASVEGIGEWEKGKGVILTIVLPDSLLPFVVPKGSICIDGVSLTIAALEGNRCTVALIPHTLEITTLGSLKKGDSVNIETDVLLRWLAHAHQR